MGRIEAAILIMKRFAVLHKCFKVKVSVGAVIASEAKQSITQRKERMDCFVAYAPRNDVDGAAPTRLSYPAHAGYPVRRGFSIQSLAPLEYWITRMRG